MGWLATEGVGLGMFRFLIVRTAFILPMATP